MLIGESGNAIPARLHQEPVGRVRSPDDSLTLPDVQLSPSSADAAHPAAVAHVAVARVAEVEVDVPRVDGRASIRRGRPEPNLRRVGERFLVNRRWRGHRSVHNRLQLCERGQAPIRTVQDEPGAVGLGLGPRAVVNPLQAG